jgi:hypothetical protein
VFDKLTITGGAGSVLWGHRVAVECTGWRIRRVKADGGDWILSATITRIDKFQSRQAPLLFTAPRPGGFWYWPIDAIEIGDTTLLAYLGPPER